ncbi:MAG: gluconokinase [Alkalibacterium gilvum]|uniref:Gluconate kinase, FGGY family n=1 Tax=Alkalibacterium gilvum TaxID=1130080 RepID=A0A1H6SFU8_9LACT|nr:MULTISPECIES: gluconokinase [Alkalibacterium]MDN6293518.1 gluconokinase [Alkalibacterium sp.]MDN6295240.1 gluconokinase [Alkalibacterium sp.]MDN6385862.1 gluconokinase [Alkalibacterium sp.]MDN6397667.1 gluconokinase [Alkalibacterium sp.]MDN6729241.1 gluconokinase [Alkalibacterium sp.]
MDYKIGIDIGTTSTKAVLYDENLTVKDSAIQAYPTFRKEKNMAEQDPKMIVHAVLSVLKTIVDDCEEIKSMIKTVSFSSAMHSVMLIDQKGNPLTPLYTWADNRSNETLQKTLKNENLDWIYKRTGTPLHSMSPFSKVLWLKQNNPSMLHKAVKIIGVKEYITYLFTGEWKIDYSIASATGLFNLEQLKWDEDVLRFIGINSDMLSNPVDTNYIFEKHIKKTYFEAGLSLKTRIVIGASDGCLANLGLGAIGQNEVAMTMGTSGAIRMVTDRIILDPEGRTFCYYLKKDKWVVGGAVNNGGNTFEWLADIFSLDYEKMNSLAENIQPGSDGLLFYPYLNGERAPLWDSSFRAHFVGVDIIHSKGHFIRALMEGVLLNLFEVLDILETIGGNAEAIKVTGGFLHSPLWKQMTADVFGKQIIISNQFESSCLGAVLIEENQTEKLKYVDTMKEVIEPIKGHTEAYQSLVTLYKELSEPIKEMHRIREIHAGN